MRPWPHKNIDGFRSFPQKRACPDVIFDLSSKAIKYAAINGDCSEAFEVSWVFGLGIFLWIQFWEKSNQFSILYRQKLAYIIVVDNRGGRRWSRHILLASDIRYSVCGKWDHPLVDTEDFPKACWLVPKFRGDVLAGLSECGDVHGQQSFLTKNCDVNTYCDISEQPLHT